jgi:lysophospholipase L1-like esterase
VPGLRDGPLEQGVAAPNSVVRKAATAYDAVAVGIYDHPAVADRDLYSADLVHASARGHAVIAAATVRALAGRIAARGFSTGRP